MFAPPVARPKTKIPVTSMPAPKSLLTEGARHNALQHKRISRPTSANDGPPLSWDFHTIPLFSSDDSNSLGAPRRLQGERLPLQAKLSVGAVSDPLEEEADRVAEDIIRKPDPEVPVSGAPPQIAGACPACMGAATLQRTKAGAAEAVRADAPGLAREALRSPGQPLERDARAYFEARFGRDFSDVRVHADGNAARSAQAMNALAYTCGRDVVFSSGRYAPQSREGRRLLAHELVHVAQQTAAPSRVSGIQRKPEKESKPTSQQKPKARQDIVLLGEGWQGGRELGIVLAQGGRVIAVKSVSEAAKALANIDGPIGTLYFVTHSTATGELKFGMDEGFTKADDIASKLKGSVPADKAPQTVDFRGCSVGNSPKAMEGVRAALGAQSIVAGKCYAVIQLSTPIKMGEKNKEKEIVNELQVSKKNRGLFNKLFKNTMRNFIAGFESKKGCLVTKTEKDFFAAGGRFVALWFNSKFSGEWIKGQSVCYGDATHQTVDPAKPAATTSDCSIIEVHAPAAQTQKP